MKNKRKMLWALTVLILAGVLICWRVFLLRPAGANFDPDSPQALRPLLTYEDRYTKLAAAVILASKGDEQGTQTFINMFPSLTNLELFQTLNLLVYMADKNRLNPKVIDLFLESNFENMGIDQSKAALLIPAGGEKAHLAHLRKAFDGIKRYHQGRPLDIVEKIIAAGDQETLQHCARVILREGGFTWADASLILSLHKNDPNAGFKSIEENCHDERLKSELRKEYSYLLSHKGYGEALIKQVPQQKPLSSEKTLPQYPDSKTPWLLRRNRINSSMQDLRVLKQAAENYYYDHSTYPPPIPGLPKPMTFASNIKPDICAWKGPYAYASLNTLGSCPDFAVASAGPDGVHDISLLHFIIVRNLKDPNLSYLIGHPIASPYVRLTKKGYECLKKFVPGCDIVDVFVHPDYGKK